MTVKRRGVFVGGYMPLEFKQFLERRAKINFTTVSNVLKHILSALPKNPLFSAFAQELLSLPKK